MSTGFSNFFWRKRKKQPTVNGQLPKEAKYQTFGFEQVTDEPGGVFQIPAGRRLWFPPPSGCCRYGWNTVRWFSWASSLEFPFSAGSPDPSVGPDAVAAVEFFVEQVVNPCVQGQAADVLGHHEIGKAVGIGLVVGAGEIVLVPLVVQGGSPGILFGIGPGQFHSAGIQGPAGEPLVGVPIPGIQVGVVGPGAPVFVELVPGFRFHPVKGGLVHVPVLVQEGPGPAAEAPGHTFRINQVGDLVVEVGEFPGGLALFPFQADVEVGGFFRLQIRVPFHDHPHGGNGGMDHLGVQFEDGGGPEGLAVVHFQPAGLAEAVGEPGPGGPFAAKAVMMIEPDRGNEQQLVSQLHFVFQIEGIGILAGRPVRTGHAQIPFDPGAPARVGEPGAPGFLVLHFHAVGKGVVFVHLVGVLGFVDPGGIPGMVEIVPGGGCPGTAHFPQPAVVGLDLPVVFPVEAVVLHMIVGSVVVVVAGGGAGGGAGGQAGELFFHETGPEVQAAVVIEPVVPIEGEIPPGAVHVGAAVVVLLPDLGQVEIEVHVQLPHVPGGKASVHGRFQAAGAGARIAALGLVLFGDDVDHASGGITAPDGGTGSPEDFHPVDLVHVDPVQLVGIHGAGGIFSGNPAAIHQDQGFRDSHAPDAYIVPHHGGTVPGHVDARGVLDGIPDVVGPFLFHFVSLDHLDRHGDLFFLQLGPGGGDHRLSQFQIVHRSIRCLCGTAQLGTAQYGCQAYRQQDSSFQPRLIHGNAPLPCILQVIPFRMFQIPPGRPVRPKAAAGLPCQFSRKVNVFVT